MSFWSSGFVTLSWWMLTVIVWVRESVRPLSWTPISPDEDEALHCKPFYSILLAYGEVKNAYTPLSQIYSGQYMSNFIRIGQVLWKIWQKYFGVLLFASQCICRNWNSHRRWMSSQQIHSMMKKAVPIHRSQHWKHNWWCFLQIPAISVRNGTSSVTSHLFADVDSGLTFIMQSCSLHPLPAAGRTVDIEKFATRVFDRIPYCNRVLNEYNRHWRYMERTIGLPPTGGQLSCQYTAFARSIVTIYMQPTIQTVYNKNKCLLNCCQANLQQKSSLVTSLKPKMTGNDYRKFWPKTESFW